MSIVCPLSGSSNVTLIEEINASDLIKMYNKFLKSDISKEFGDLKKIGYYHCIDSDLRFFYPMVTGSENFYEHLQNLEWYYMDEKDEYDYAKNFIEPIWYLSISRYRESEMPYSSSLTDREWEIIEPLLPQKKRTRPPRWSKRQILDGVLYQLKNGCNWCDLPQDLPPYSTVFWHYKQWRTARVLDPIMTALHGRVRQHAKKNRAGQPCC